MTPWRMSVFKFMRSVCGPIVRAIAAHTAGPLAASASRSQRACRLQKIRICILADSALRKAASAHTSSGKSAFVTGANFSTGLPGSQPKSPRRALPVGVG
jgi:hypothetical protein